MLENHSIIFNRIISRIDLDQNTDFQKGFYVVSEELFQGQVLTWGRIVSLFAYGARLAQHCVENDMSNMVIDVVSSLSHVAVDKLTPFLKDHGGWVRKIFVWLLKILESKKNACTFRLLIYLERKHICSCKICKDFRQHL